MPAISKCGSCGDCPRCKRAAYMRAWYRLPGRAEAQRQSQKESRQRRHGDVLAYDRERPRRYYPEQQKARNTVNKAILRGQLERPKFCESCGSEGEPFLDGRAPIQAHHDDYDKPLEVMWLCRSCHGKRHRRIA